MGFEFRRFKQINAQEYQLAVSENKDQMETKDDSYFIIVDKEGKIVIPDTIGIKLADMTDLEIKVQKKKKAGIEKWKKIHIAEKVDASDQESLLKTIENQLKINDILDISLSSDTHKAIIALTHKIRKQTQLQAQKYELGFFSLKFENMNEAYYKTVNIEGEKEIDNIDKQLIEKDLPLSSQDIQVLTCGYPELLTKKYLEMAQQSK
ncbi:hypothetical protein NAEGRDRAFT_81470 [Naegleria gruberi]|uniref:Uncharacterized protein n=1 Tax=Naegleria gruberi TaxID=5762 RepID=D2VWD6_NAEGR|nr:uncharacterized protein NAEGRDRAFT_81470 [Naegleria gruberi]EFC38817.1 hypothetical protein NAEGRDRAFT_81470 [Naegleria gruberi]|eukprot:XP_002671561.1 hypothetical protein NAEGRDRAFT_81470 [Naegleria gruberi strain NEG-M]